MLGGPNGISYVNGIINLNGGTLTAGSIIRGNTNVGPSSTSVVLNANSGTVQAVNSASNSNFFNGIFVNLASGGLTFNTASNAVTITNSMSGTGGFTKTGLGVLTLTGSNVYSGATNVSGGTLVIGVAGALPNANSVAVGLGATLVADSQTTVSSVSSLNINGNLIVHNGVLSTLNSAVATGFGGGSWNGAGGIVSTAAASDTTHLHALGVIQNDDGTGSGNALYSTFEGQSTVDSDVLVKYTYYGDTDLNGEVDGSDYSRIDNAYLHNINNPGSPLTGWFNGDFNYDGVIDGSDYTLIDNAFNSQGVQIAAEIAAPTAQIAGGAASAVPEPATLGLLGIGAVGLLGRRRRK
jgi:autotransporter-associated beta strand protein